MAIMTTTETIDHWIKILQAWNNEEIQYRIFDDRWPDGGKWFTTKQQLPNFEKYEYRIKPEVKKYRVGLMDFDIEDRLLIVVRSESDATELESDPDFIKWLSDWVEYEV